MFGVMGQSGLCPTEIQLLDAPRAVAPATIRLRCARDRRRQFAHYRRQRLFTMVQAA